MNIERGLLRLWIVASATWLVAALVLLEPWEDVERARTNYRRDLLAAEQAMLPAESLVGAGEEYLSRAKGEADIAKAQDVLRAWKAQLDGEQIILDRLRAGHPDYLAALTFPTLFIGLPPLTLLLLGVALCWAFRGFRRDGEQP